MFPMFLPVAHHDTAANSNNSNDSNDPSAQESRRLMESVLQAYTQAANNLSPSFAQNFEV